METSRIKTLLENQPHALWLEFFPRTGDRRTGLLESFLQPLIAAGLPLALGDPRSFDDLELPALAVGADGSFRHFYQAIPQGPEGPPFLTLLEILAAGVSGLEPETQSLLKKDFQRRYPGSGSIPNTWGR